MIVVLGASGFLGRHLVNSFVLDRSTTVRAAVRDPGQFSCAHNDGDRIQYVKADFADPDSIVDVIDPHCTVINLVYMNRAGAMENQSAAARLVEVCARRGVRRLIHCSTAAVVGRAASSLITEETTCRPTTEYGRTKLGIEHAMLKVRRGVTEVSILRPTAVFGTGGQNLLKLAGDLLAGSRGTNYARSCLFGSRHMHLVCVENVVAALRFLSDSVTRIDGEIFNISDCEDPENIFSAVEKILMVELPTRGHGIPRIPLPAGLLSTILWLRGRDIINPAARFSSEKLSAWGFVKPITFGLALRRYARSTLRDEAMRWVAGQVAEG